MTEECERRLERQWKVLDLCTALYSNTRIEKMEEIKGLHLSWEKVGRAIVLYMKAFVTFMLLLLLEGIFMCDHQKW